MTSKVIIFVVLLCLIHVSFAGIRVPRLADGETASVAGAGISSGGGSGGKGEGGSGQNLGSFAGVFEKLPKGFLESFTGFLEKFKQ